MAGVAGAALVALGLLTSVMLLTQRPPAVPTQGSPTAPSLPAPTVQVPTTVAPPARHVFPVLGEVSYAHSHHGYPATDIMADCGLTYVAPYPGVVDEVSRVDRYDPVANDGATRGGLSVSIVGDDGVRYYGSHFSAIAKQITPGHRVAAGDPVATVGRTGDAGACHVHFGLSPVCADGDWFVRRGVVWPWSYLDSWRAGEDAQPRPEIVQWLAAAGCPDRPTVEP